MLFLLLSFLAADPDRSEGVSPTVVVRDSSFAKPTVRNKELYISNLLHADITWVKDLTRPDDILMESKYTYKGN